MKSNIFSENIHPKIILDEKDERKSLTVARKILNHYLKDENIFKNSCIASQGKDFNLISFDILYCDDKKTHDINKEYRNKDYAADIITFAIFADSSEKFVFDGEVNLGEIIISLDKVRQNALEKNTSDETELYFLISHGIMHLLGFDHQTDEEYNFIIEAQNSALKSLGI